MNEKLKTFLKDANKALYCDYKCEDNGDLVIYAAVPGVKREGVSLAVFHKGDELTIACKVTDAGAGRCVGVADGDYFCIDEINANDYDVDSVKAIVEDGYVRVTMAAKQEKMFNIKIK